MKRLFLRTVRVFFCLSLTGLWSYARPRAPLPPAFARSTELHAPRAAEASRRLAPAFEANLGQTDARVKFLSRSAGYTVFLTPSEAVVALRESDRQAPAAFRMTFPGSNPEPRIAGQDQLPGETNYLIGNNPAKWQRHIPSYGQVRYRDIFPGVDLIYHGNRGELEYDFVVAPGAGVDTIRLAFPGSQNPRVNGQGDLLLNTRGTEVRFRKPVVYQPGTRGKHFLEGAYVLQPRDHGDSGVDVGFAVARYDPRQPLIIDPVLSYSTYLGGSGSDAGIGIAVDSSGSAYITGSTNSADFPTATPLQSGNAGGYDAFVAKLDPTGSTLVYSTYFGGGKDDTATGIAVDGIGNAYVTGYTASTDFPVVNSSQAVYGGGPNDAFAAKLDSTGSTLLYSTYLGGSGDDAGFSIAADSAGNAFVTGYTNSKDFPTANPLQAANGGSFRNAFVANLDPSGSTLLYSTYLGGSGDDLGFGIAVDGGGNAYVTGWVTSTDFPTANPFQPANGGRLDAFVAKLDSSGSTLLYSTYFGGTSEDSGQAIAVDSDGNAYVTGYTCSTNFPTANALQSANAGGYDAFVAKLDSNGALLYSTYFGGSSYDLGGGIAVDGAGNAYVTGSTLSANLPTADALQPANAGGYDAFVASFDATGSTLLFSTYLGGVGEDRGAAIALDNAGNAYVTGRTLSADFPTASPLQSASGGGSDAFIATLAVSAGGRARKK